MNRRFPTSHAGGGPGGGAGARGGSGAAGSGAALPFASSGATASSASPGISGAGLVSSPLGRDESLDAAARHTASGVLDRLARLDPRTAIREATGWTPSYVDMVLLLLGFGAVVFTLFAGVLLGGRTRQTA